MTAAEKCRADIEALQISNPGSGPGVLTISIGVASMVPTENIVCEELIRVATRTLKNTIEQGRNPARIARRRSIASDDSY